MLLTSFPLYVPTHYSLGTHEMNEYSNVPVDGQWDRRYAPWATMGVPLGMGIGIGDEVETILECKEQEPFPKDPLYHKQGS